VEAKHNIQCGVIMHSQIVCGEKLELMGSKALILGGVCRVGKEIIAKTIGSSMSTVTELDVGVVPYVKERYTQVRIELVKIKEEINKTQQIISYLSNLEKTNKLPDDKKEIFEKTQNTFEKLTQSEKTLKDEFEELEKEINENDNGIVKVYTVIYPGTRVSIGNAVEYITEINRSCILSKDGVDIKISTK
jgi:uncharacterized protein (DUF342 family)